MIFSLPYIIKIDPAIYRERWTGRVQEIPRQDIWSVRTVYQIETRLKLVSVFAISFPIKVHRQQSLEAMVVFIVKWSTMYSLLNSSGSLRQIVRKTCIKMTTVTTYRVRSLSQWSRQSVIGLRLYRGWCVEVVTSER